MERPFKKILIIGAGPSGLLLALRLAQAGIPVHVLDAAAALDPSPRAAYYGAPALPELARVGILDEVRRRGMVVDTLCWRRFRDHGYIAGLDGAVLADVDGQDLRTACLVLQELDRLMLDAFVDRYGGEVSWRHKVVEVGQDREGAWVEVEAAAEGGARKRLEADYVVGCDGANSAVRKSLFGNHFPGFTWDAQIIATNTYYDFEKFGFHHANFIIHPEHFFMAAKITADGLYRITYGETPGLTADEYRARQPAKFAAMLPGHPGPGAYRVVDLAPYRMHQRCAPSLRVGRVLLAADAAHLCSPWGGLGITGGLVDAGGLADCLVGLWEGRADAAILDVYSAVRMDKWRTVIDPVSQENFRRVSDPDPDTRFERDDFLQMCVRGQEDEAVARTLLLGAMAIRYDFTQHFKDRPEGLPVGGTQDGADGQPHAVHPV